MSRIVTTEFGKFNHIADGWLWECPQCGAFDRLSVEQMAGTRIVACRGPSGLGGCDYSEMHPYGVTLLAVIQSRLLTGAAAHDQDG